MARPVALRRAWAARVACALDAEIGGQARDAGQPGRPAGHGDVGAELVQRARDVIAEAICPGHAEHDAAPAGEQRHGATFGNQASSDAGPCWSYSASARWMCDAASAAVMPPTHIASRAIASRSLARGTP